MFRLVALIVTISVLYCACSGQKKAGASKKSPITVVPDNAIIDSSEFSDEYIITPAEKAIQGKWAVTAMYRQPGAAAENLTDVTLTMADSAFGGKAPCNSIAGTCILKNTSIRFTDIVATKMACGKLEQETAYLNLLQNAVSNFAFSENKLLLKDGNGRVVFECLKE